MEIQDHPDYLIYPDGRVFNKRLKRDISQRSDKEGYLHVQLNNGSRTSRYVHRLLALCYIPNPENKPFVDHINGITSDNRLENLRWVTKQENNNNRKLNSNNTSGITGIRIDNRYKKVKYIAAWREGGKQKTKTFANIVDAAAYRLQKLTELGMADFQRK